MKTRDQYVNQLKTQLDRWNEDVTRWEGELDAAKRKADSRWRADLKKLQAQREKALYQLTLLEKASESAWRDFAAGADEAWAALGRAFEEARTHFEKSPKAPAR
jgi:hypothetical protein